MSHWETVTTSLSKNISHHKFVLTSDSSRVLSFGRVIELWCDEAIQGDEFRALTTATLADSPFSAFKWETPVLDKARLNRDFEFVLLESAGLDRKENPTAFAEHFKGAPPDALTLCFPNLGRNAVMVVPTPSRHLDVNHCHLAAYLRTANLNQVDDFWFHIGKAMKERVSDKPVWLSTAGGGVAWLHGRLDDRPKYYGYKPFKAS